MRKLVALHATARVSWLAIIILLLVVVEGVVVIVRISSGGGGATAAAAAAAVVVVAAVVAAAALVGPEAFASLRIPVVGQRRDPTQSAGILAFAASFRYSGLKCMTASI
jgi:drug/metabolite transporter (DMT)-like permease